MKNILNSFLTVWTSPISKNEKQNSFASHMGKSETGISEFFRGIEIFSKSRKYSFK